ncbi:translation initiation factor eIF-2B subunit beta [Melampsora americana]|nr:translation initiation factor eIF-2B subunit beta [Melampsora americana]
MVHPIFSSDSLSKPIIINRINQLSIKLKLRQIIGSLSTALETIKLLREVIASSRFNSFEELCNHLIEIGKFLSTHAPTEFVIGNIVKRVVILLREEYASALATHLITATSTPAIEKDEIKSTYNLPTSSSSTSIPISSTSTENLFRLLGQKLLTPDSHDHLSDHQGPGKAERNFSKKAASLKPIFIEAVQELHDELELTRENVANQAAEHIHSGEVIMTMDHSRTVQSFLQAAAKNRRTFTVIVAETAPNFSGRSLAAELASATPPVETLIISDASSFALMSRCTKLIIGCHAIFADGSVLAKSGALGLALAARAHLVPVVVVSGMYKFSPEYLRAGEEWAICDQQSPEEVLMYNSNQTQAEEEEEVKGRNEVKQDQMEESKVMGEVEVLNPYYDRIPGELVSLFITNLGGHPSSLVYRLLKDLYGTS